MASVTDEHVAATAAAQPVVALKPAQHVVAVLAAHAVRASPTFQAIGAESP